MTDTFFQSEAPSNLALIKYMGKKKGEKNHPLNSSFSLTLKEKKTLVVIEPMDSLDVAKKDEWESLSLEDFKKIKASQGSSSQALDSFFENVKEIELSEAQKKRFLDHFLELKDTFLITGFFKIKSANNFFSDCGLASSASSFAALTKCSYKVAQSQNPQSFSAKEDLQHQLAHLSARGSGSSSRSFFSPCALWSSDNSLSSVELKPPFDKISHSVVVVDTGKKQVSSSEAHQRVLTSPLMKGRTKRAEFRLEKLLRAIDKGEWRAAHYVIWEEFFDMHSLFRTSQPRFSYITKESEEVLAFLQEHWTSHADGPLVTMDAGANIHLIFREEQEPLKIQLKSIFEKKWKVI